MGGSAGKLYQALKHPEDEKKLKASFQRYDLDKSGVLERVELQKVSGRGAQRFSFSALF
jgi:Ca2+-binding EF-hand superfamily protein